MHNINNKSNQIAIISYNINSDHMNYGAALHSYAFQKILQSKNIESTIIDYVPRDLEKYSIKYPILNLKKNATIKETIKHFLNFGGRGFVSNLRKYRKFLLFFRKYTIKTQKKYSYHELMTLNTIEGLEFNTYVAECDVIWKNYWEEGYFDDVFYLNIPAAKGKHKVAYAPSLSSRPFSKEELLRFKELIDDYAAISTREKQSADYLTRILGKNISNMLDSTLLLDDLDYTKIAKCPKQKNYVLLYNCMINDKQMIVEAEKFASQRKLPLVEVSIWNSNRYIYNHTVIVDAGIEEWLGWFKCADFVICNAFHGLCFSVIFRKNFFVFQRDESDFRMKSLVTLLGLNNRFIKFSDKRIPLEIEDIDYELVYLKLNNERVKSMNYIMQNIVNYKSK